MFALAEKYSVKPASKNFPHLEIAAIFLSYCSSYFLKENGKIAFVLPRSFFSAYHHDNTRSGTAKGFQLTKIWDLNSVSPLFRIPSGVLFAEKAKRSKKNGEEPTKWKELPASGLAGKSFYGNLPSHNCNFKIATPQLTETDEKWFYVRQGKSSAFSLNKHLTVNKINPYKKLFKQGATIVPRSFYFVQLNQETPPDFDDRIINIVTSKTLNGDAKIPWKGLFFSGKEIQLHSPDKLMQNGYRYAWRWFQDKENIWDKLKTEKNKKISSEKYLNWHNKLTDQNLNVRYLVLYNSSAKDANAVVVDRNMIDFERSYLGMEFIVESVTYVCFTNDAREAHYLAAILNSSTPNLMMKDFQAKGLFGARHVHKRILDIYYPKFDKYDKTHRELGLLSVNAHKKASEYLEQNIPQKELTAIHLGRLCVFHSN